MHVPTVVAIACVAYGASLMLHESAHALVGWMAGGRPTLISTTDVRGDWSGLSTTWFTAIGVSGSIMNWLIAAVAAWLAGTGRGSAGTRWAAWLLLAINGFIPSMYMIVSPLFRFGDWDTVLRRWPGALGWRALVAVIGIGSSWWWTRVAAGRLSGLIGVPPGASRVALIHRLVMTSWASGGVLAAAAAALSPLGPLWAVGIGVGSSLGTTWLLLPASQMAEAGSAPKASGITGVPALRGWLWAGVLAATVFVAVFGRGVRLG